VKRIEDRVRAFAQKLLDERIGSGGFDFVEEYGAQIPALVIATMLGTPDSDVEEIRHITDASLTQVSPSDDQASEEVGYRNIGMASADREVGNRIGQYYLRQIQARRRNPTDDIVSALVTMEFTDEQGVTRQLNDKEALAQITLLSTAGNETTARHIGWAGATLALYPDQRAKLVAQPELIPNAVEEILRYEPPSMCLARVPTRDVVWCDQVVPEGAVLVVIHAATGRDPRQFPDPDPDTLDVERRIDRHLSFGFGAHVCLGASLARLESRIALEEMLKRFPEWDVEWNSTEIVHTGSAVRGYSKLPITLT
jgi:cytochrome P450